MARAQPHLIPAPPVHPSPDPVPRSRPGLEESVAQPVSAAEILNALTVDVEEHFQVSGFEGTVHREDWESHPSRVEANTERILEFLDETGIRATFFVLGWVAERRRGLVRKIAEAGHEVGCHGYSHRLVYTQTPEEFRRETTRSKAVLEEAAGGRVTGYRAASFSIKRPNLWAMDVLVESGFLYDSSLYPVVHDRYGIPGAPRHPYRLRTRRGNDIVEVPPSTFRLGRVVVPVAGGGYLRLYPLRLTRWAIERIHAKDRLPVIVYVHPWETDAGQPRIAAPWLNRFRHYVGIRGTIPKLRHLVQRFRFATLGEMVRGMKDLPEIAL